MSEETLISKTRRKREMHQLQDVGERLVELTEAQLADLALPEPLFDAVMEAKRLRKHEARRRQLQYIGKLMRSVDAEPIKEQLAAWDGSSCQHTAWMHRIEQWRTRIIDSESALDELVREYPHADLQHLRTLIRNIERERTAGKPPKSFRALFQELKALIPEPLAPPSHNGEGGATP